MLLYDYMLLLLGGNSNLEWFTTSNCHFGSF